MGDLTVEELSADQTTELIEALARTGYDVPHTEFIRQLVTSVEAGDPPTDGRSFAYGFAYAWLLERGIVNPDLDRPSTPTNPNPDDSRPI